MSKGYVATHSILFEEPAHPGAGLCDICKAAIPEDDDVLVGTAPPGRGLVVTTRGGEVRFEEPPLCASCGTAIGVMALAQWDIEEEEG